MSTISSIGSTPTVFKPVAPVTNQPQPAKAAASPARPNDPDGDGDTDGPGVDVKG